MDLRLDHVERPGKLAGGGDRLFDAHRRVARGDRHAELGEEILGLIFVDVHGAGLKHRRGAAAREGGRGAKGPNVRTPWPVRPAFGTRWFGEGWGQGRSCHHWISENPTFGGEPEQSVIPDLSRNPSSLRIIARQGIPKNITAACVDRVRDDASIQAAALTHPHRAERRRTGADPEDLRVVKRADAVQELADRERGGGARQIADPAELSKRKRSTIRSAMQAARGWTGRHYQGRCAGAPRGWRRR